MSYSWDLPDNDTKFWEYWEKYQNALGALLATHLGPDDPAETGTQHAVPGSRWDHTSTVMKAKARKSDDSGWYIVHDLDKDYGGLLPRAGTATYPMTGILDLDGKGLILDEDGDSQLLQHDDDVLKLLLGDVEHLRLGENVGGANLLDLLGQLRLAQPQGITTGAAGSVWGKFPLDVDGAGTVKYVELKDAP